MVFLKINSQINFSSVVIRLSLNLGLVEGNILFPQAVKQDLEINLKGGLKK